MNCKTLGGHLPSVHSVFENMYLTDKAREVLTRTDGFMIGGEKLTGPWSWIDGTVWDYDDWAEGEPINTTTRNCLRMDIARGQWYAYDCFAGSSYVCETSSLSTNTALPPTLPPTTASPCSYQNNSCETIDIVFIVQVSQSINGNYFTQYVKQFIKDVGGAFYMVGDSPSGRQPSRVAVVEFASAVNVTLPLVARTRENFDKLIDDHVYYENQGIKNITIGLQAALDIFQNASPPPVNTIAILMVDSVTTFDIKQAKMAADSLRNFVYFLAGVGIEGINGNDVEANITNMATLIGNSHFAFGNIDAANDPTTGILPRALNIYPCSSSCDSDAQNIREKELIAAFNLCCGRRERKKMKTCLSIILVVAICASVNGVALLKSAKGATSCPQNGQLSPDGRFCWFIRNVSDDFVSSEMDCVQNYNGHLASIHNVFENLKLTDVAREIAAAYGNMFAVGANRLTGDDIWTWTDGTLFNYHDWSRGEPVEGEQRDCATVDIAYGAWYAANCYDKHAYVCQTPSSNNQPFTTLATPKKTFKN
uniref:C-type lectin n=1 Tax=Panagrolaimus sp. JU765 TaxID=591449 RepID=A0AC34QWP7_9BILA